MRRNLDALRTELYCAISNWNDFTESDTGERILTEAEVSAMASDADMFVFAELTKAGLI